MCLYHYDNLLSGLIFKFTYEDGIIILTLYLLSNYIWSVLKSEIGNCNVCDCFFFYSFVSLVLVFRDLWISFSLINKWLYQGSAWLSINTTDEPSNNQKTGFEKQSGFWHWWLLVCTNCNSKYGFCQGCLTDRNVSFHSRAQTTGTNWGLKCCHGYFHFVEEFVYYPINSWHVYAVELPSIPHPHNNVILAWEAPGHPRRQLKLKVK